MRKGQVTIFVIMVLVVISVVALGVYYKNNDIQSDDKVSEEECVVDDDCVPASCCHALSCVSITEKPECAGIYCTQECQPGTLDCGQGSCQCINKKCSAVFK